MEWSLGGNQSAIDEDSLLVALLALVLQVRAVGSGAIHTSTAVVGVGARDTVWATDRYQATVNVLALSQVPGTQPCLRDGVARHCCTITEKDMRPGGRNTERCYPRGANGPGDRWSMRPFPSTTPRAFRRAAGRVHHSFDE